MIEVVAENVPPGLGAPVYGKLDAELAAALMSINAVKGVEIGDGFATAAMTGEENADEMRMGNDGRPRFLVQPRRRHPRRHLDRPGGRRALRREADLLDPQPAQDGRPLRQRDRDRHQGPPRPLRRHPRGADRRSHGGMRDRGSLSASQGAGRRRRAGLAVREAMTDTQQRVTAAIEAFGARRDRRRHRRRRPRERGRPGHRRGARHAGEDGVHHPQHLRHRLRAADRPRPRAGCTSRRWSPRTTRRTAPRSPSSVDYQHGTTTGISAEDRIATVRGLANNNAGAADFVRPGHIFPLIAKDGGVLMRSGHTEAAIDLCRLANLEPVGVICELVNDDGTVMRGPQIKAFAEKHKLKHISVADLIAYRQAREKLVERVGEFSVETAIGPLKGYAYVTPFDKVHHMALVHGRIGDGARRADPAASRQRHRRRVRRREDGQRRARALQAGRPRRDRVAARRHRRRAGAGAAAGRRERRRSRAHAPVARGRAGRADPAGPRRALDPALLDQPAHLCRLAGFGIEITETEGLEG